MNFASAPDPHLGHALLGIARNALAERLDAPIIPTADHPRLAQAGATFVTLLRSHQLRGCIGSLEAWRPLREDVHENAIAAAFRDPRFPPLSASEFPGIEIEVSLLTTPEPIGGYNEAQIRDQLRPDIDGAILVAGADRHHVRATFLPQVWEQLPEPVEFLRHLKRKAGLPDHYWSSDTRLLRYTVDKWTLTRSNQSVA